MPKKASYGTSDNLRYVALSRAARRGYLRTQDGSKLNKTYPKTPRAFPAPRLRDFADNDLPVTRTPASNTGVEMTRADRSTGPEVFVGVDYVHFSKPALSEVQAEELVAAVCRRLGSNGEACRLGFGYEGVDVAQYGSIGCREHQDGRVDVLLRLPGRACEYLRINEDFCWSDKQLVTWGLSLFGRCTRLDLALDVAWDGFGVGQVERALVVGDASTRARQFNAVTGKRGIGCQDESGNVGKTVYVGDRQSEKFLRVYDKAAEFRAKTGNELCRDLVRFELELKGDTAQSAAETVSRDGVGCVPSLLRGYIDFTHKESRSDSRRSRRPLADWWARIVAAFDRVRLKLIRGIATPETRIKWVTHSVKNTLRALLEFDLWELVSPAIGRAELNEVQRKEWLNYKAFLSSENQICRVKI